jgi:hypothetical protein
VKEIVLAPRPVPNRVLPVVAGGFIVLLALPVYALAGWRLQGWGLGAVLWVGSQALGLLLARLQLGMGNLAASGVLAIGMMFRAIAVMAVVFAVAVSDPRLALSAALLYALAYTFELGLSLATYFGAPAR